MHPSNSADGIHILLPGLSAEEWLALHQCGRLARLPKTNATADRDAEFHSGAVIRGQAVSSNIKSTGLVKSEFNPCQASDLRH
jgi:hypothetical protein